MPGSISPPGGGDSSSGLARPKPRNCWRGGSTATRWLLRARPCPLNHRSSISPCWSKPATGRQRPTSRRSPAARSASALPSFGAAGGTEVSLVFTDDAQGYQGAECAPGRGKDKPTNVLSFPAVSTVSASASAAASGRYRHRAGDCGARGGPSKMQALRITILYTSSSTASCIWRDMIKEDDGRGRS